ncbi:MAG: deoxyribose-phosphate aldolase [Propionicimonas sp.]|uniref:deoxyribose-phosphate aldolase n=1 Tax=Propionicimonas sp. TaxID=1955623 RepID=UPI003D09E450
MKPTKAAAEMSVPELAAYIDHSILKPDFTPSDVRREVEAAIGYGCRTVCINPASIEIAAPLCAGTGTGVCVVVDFPFGCSSTESKVAQTRIALAAGIQELDVVANYGWVRGGELARVEDDLRAVIEPCHEAGVVVKVIFETDALSYDQIAAVAEAAIAAGADFIKTSTGFYTGTNQHDRTGAFDEMVAFMIECAAGRCAVKGSGSIRDRAHFLRLIDAGIDRMGIGYRSTPVVLGIESGAAGASAPGGY